MRNGLGPYFTKISLYRSGEDTWLSMEVVELV